MGKSEEDVTAGPKWGIPVIFAVIVGVLAMAMYAAKRGDWTGMMHDFSILLLIGGAALVVGVFVGFLFGIPREPKDSAEADTTGGPPRSSRFKANTNLVEISDWLTKIIVGVGLVQLAQIPPKLAELSAFLAKSFDPTVPQGTIVAILFYFAITGFFLGYLWTRLFLAGEFSRAEGEAIGSAQYQEGLINALLYQSPPDGFRLAIERAKQYFKDFGETNDRVWAYLACAYGQEFAFEKRAAKPENDKLAESRKNALDAIDRALQINPANKQFLKGLWSRELALPGQDDLLVFFDDPDFQQRFG